MSYIKLNKIKNSIQVMFADEELTIDESLQIFNAIIEEIIIAVKDPDFEIDSKELDDATFEATSLCDIVSDLEQAIYDRLDNEEEVLERETYLSFNDFLNVIINRLDSMRE